MFRLEVTAENGAELINKLRSLVGAVDMGEGQTGAIPGAISTAMPVPAEAQPAKRGPGRPRKNAEPAAPEPAVVEVIEPPKDKPSRDDATYALREVNNKHGMAKVLELLKLHNVTRVGELKPDQYEAFIASCQAAVDGD